MDWNQTLKAADGLEVNELPDGYVIYEQATDRVHYLNRTAVLVFELCNGSTRAADIPELLRTIYDLPAAPTAEVEQCIAQLLDEGLLLKA